MYMYERYGERSSDSANCDMFWDQFLAEQIPVSERAGCFAGEEFKCSPLFDLVTFFSACK